MMFGEFDEAAYLRANPDVRGMIERGIVRSGFEHWHAVGANEHALGDRMSGFYEHDLIYDEAAYLRQNPDVQDAVRRRAVRNGYQHWIRFGRQEFARGVRAGPFAASGGLLRPFKLPVGNRALFVGVAPEGFENPDLVEFRAGTGTPVVATARSAVCSVPLTLADACDRTRTLRVVVAWSPADFDVVEVQKRARIGVSIRSTGGAQLSFVHRDWGVQAFSFPTADDANAILAAARAAWDEPGSPAPLPVVDFVLARLARSPRLRGYEVPDTFRVEQTVPDTTGGTVMTGWVAVPTKELAGFRAWRPGMAEFFDLTRKWSRTARPDVVDRFRAELGAGQAEQFGFRATTAAPLAAPNETVLFGVAKMNQPEEWIELDCAPKGQQSR